MGAAMDAAVEATMQELKILPAVLEEAQHRDPPERRYTANNPFVLSDILEVIPKLQPSSPGVDGWQVSELKALGEPSFKRLAKLYHSIESTAVRPGNLLEVPVTTSKKGAGETPLQVCPISLTSHVYRIYGLRYVGHNFSLGIFHGCQMNCMVVFPIGKQWTLIFRLLWILNKPNSSINPLYGALYDYQKCFDRIAWQIQTGILQDLGMPKKVSSAMFSYNQSILRRFKIGKSVAPTFSNTNSICQGCPLAIIRIYAMIAMWIQVIKTHPHTTLCKASAFIDDKNLRSTSFEAFCTAIDNTRSFDKAVDAQMFLPLTR